MQNWPARVAAVAPDDVSALLTLLILATYSAGSRVLLPLVALGVVLPPVRRTVWFWGVAAAIISWHLATGWFDLDNHKWLIGYWCLALALAQKDASAERQQLGASARLLIGGAFAIAVIQKLLRPEFRDGAFWVVTFIQEGRFHGVTEAIFGLSARELGILHGLLRQAMEGTGEPFSLLSEVPAWMLWAGRLMSLVTLALEAAVAVTFLAPRPTLPHRLRNACLAVFLVATYPLAPVTGFGWILTAMALAQVDAAETRAKAAFLFLCVVMPLYVFLRSLIF